MIGGCGIICRADVFAGKAVLDLMKVPQSKLESGNLQGKYAREHSEGNPRERCLDNIKEWLDNVVSGDTNNYL